MPLDAFYVDGGDTLRPFGGAPAPVDPPDPGFPPHTIFGAATAGYYGTGRNHLQEWNAHLAVFPNTAIYRTYNTQGAPSDNWDWNTLSGNQNPRIPGWETRWSHISPKPTLSKVLSGELHEAIKESIWTIPVTGQKRLVTMWHEPDVKIGSGTFTPQDWKRAAYLYGLAVREAAHPDVLYGPCFTGRWHIIDTGYCYTIMESTDDDLASVCDFVAWDPYNEASRLNQWNPNRYGAAGCAYWFDPVFDFSDQYFPGCKVVIGETGMVPNPADPALRPQWIHDSMQYFLDRNVLAVQIFDVGPPNATHNWQIRVRQTSFDDVTTSVADPGTIEAWNHYLDTYPLPS